MPIFMVSMNGRLCPIAYCDVCGAQICSEDSTSSGNVLFKWPRNNKRYGVKSSTFIVACRNLRCSGNKEQFPLSADLQVTIAQLLMNLGVVKSNQINKLFKEVREDDWI